MWSGAGPCARDALLAAPQLLFSAPAVMHVDREGMPPGDFGDWFGSWRRAIGSRDRVLADGASTNKKCIS
jgi:hypothetical protein